MHRIAMARRRGSGTRVAEPLKIALPNKGRLADRTLEMFRQAGIVLETVSERRLFASALDGELTILFARAHDIPEYVQDGIAHAGVTGYDLVAETGKNVRVLTDLGYGKCRLVLAVPEQSRVRGIRSVPSGWRVATSFPHLTRAYFRRHGKRVTIVEVSGATELTPHVGVADAIVDLTATGSTLAMNRMRPVSTILESSARLIANRRALASRNVGNRVRELAFALESVVHAHGKRYLMANVPRARLEEVARILPGISGPTIVEIGSRKDMVAAHAVVEEGHVYRVVNGLKAIGAEGILVVPVERLVP